MTVIKLLERREYAEKLQADEAGGLAIRKGIIPLEIKAEGDNTIRFIISDGSLDRDHDTINVNGWDLTNYLKNPVVLWAHEHHSVPIGKGSDIHVEDGQLIADAEFVGKDIMEFAHMIYQLYLGGFMNAVSVGFMPDERVWSDEQGGIKFLTQELLEFSTVPVPANPNALQIARSTGGIDIAPLKAWSENILDQWEDQHSLGASRKAIERMFKEADDKKQNISIPDEKVKEVRQRNIWEPRLKEYDESGEWDYDEWGARPYDWKDYGDDSSIPEFIRTEYLEAIEATLDAYAEELKGCALIEQIAEATGTDLKELVVSLGHEVIEVLRNTPELEDSMVIMSQEDLDNGIELLAVKDLEITTALEKLAELEVESGRLLMEKDIELTELKEEMEELLKEMATAIAENSRQIDPAKIAEIVGASIAKVVKGITGKID